MDTNSARRFSRFTFYVLMALGAALVTAVADLVLCAGLGINPFRERTTAFLVAAFVGLVGIAVIAFLLNVATSLSIIADANKPPGGTEKAFPFQRALFGTLLVGVLSLVIIVGGTWYSERKFLNVVQNQTEEMLKQNEELVSRLAPLISSGTRKDFTEIASVLSFLGAQRRGLPSLTLIYDGKFQGRPALYRASNYVSTSNDPYRHEYYECIPGRDCEYLKAFFAGEKQSTLSSVSRGTDVFYLYYPVVVGQRRFMLLFERQNSYGKMGS